MRYFPRPDQIIHNLPKLNLDLPGPKRVVLSRANVFLFRVCCTFGNDVLLLYGLSVARRYQVFLHTSAMAAQPPNSTSASPSLRIICAGE
jgi:hypothetical protein